MSRWKASGIHLLLSAAIAGAVVLFMLTVWYPWPLFEAAGGSYLVLILVAVDVTLGPLITLVIFKAGKWGLKFDLTVIAALQIAALAYGIHTVYLARPVYLAFTVDRFELVSAKDIDPADLASVTREEFKRLPLGRPRYVAAVQPADQNERLRIMGTALKGKDLQLYPQYYVPYAEQMQDALTRAKPLNKLAERAPEAVEDYLRSSGRARDSVRYVPMMAARHNATVIVDAASGAVLDILLVDPWQSPPSTRHARGK
jgi:hypothetical protein